MLAMVSTLVAAEPPEGKVVTSQMLDATTVVRFHERGISLAHLNLETMTVDISYAVDGPPSFTTTWVDTDGSTQSVTTTATGNSNTAVMTAIVNHKRAVKMLKAVFPPVNPN